MLRVTVAALAAAGVCASVALADDSSPPIAGGGGPVPGPSAVLLLPDDPATLVVHTWRSDRIGGVVRERVSFTFCSSRNLRPLRVSVTESRGWDRHAARPAGTPRFVQGRRFTLRLDRRYPVDVPQCRELSYSWRPKRVMRLPGVRALDVTVTFPRSSGPRWPTELTDHETVLG